MSIAAKSALVDIHPEPLHEEADINPPAPHSPDNQPPDQVAHKLHIDTMSDKAAELEQEVIKKLRTVFDPEIPVNIYDLGLIYDIQFQPAMEDRFDVTVTMTLTTPGCPVAGSMPGLVERAISDIPHLHLVTVKLVWDPPWDKSRMSDEVRLQLNMY